MSTIKVNAIQNTSGVEQYLCKAWVNFNGTGTVAIRASGNVSSITDNGTGDYTVNFTTAMPDANYGWAGNVGFPSDSTEAAIWERSDFRTTTALRLKMRNVNNTQVDRDYVLASVFR